MRLYNQQTIFLLITVKIEQKCVIINDEDPHCLMINNKHVKKKKKQPKPLSMRKMVLK